MVAYVILVSGVPRDLLAQTLYTDFNGTTAGFGTTPTAGLTWDIKGGNARIWGSSSGTASLGFWVNAATPNNAVFGAGASGVASGTRLDANLGGSINVGTMSASNDIWNIATGSNVLTFNSNTSWTMDSSFLISGSGSVVKQGSNTLTITGSNSYSGGTTVSAGTLSLSSTAALASGSNVTLSGGTLQLSAAGTYTLGTINVTANSVIDFGGAGVTNLSLTNLTISSGVTLRIDNWVRLSDQFTVTSAPTIGGTAVVAGANISKSSINFSNYGELAQWNGAGFSANSLAAIPEPSTYGAMLMAGCAGLFGLRRWRAKRRATPGSVEVGS